MAREAREDLLSRVAELLDFVLADAYDAIPEAEPIEPLRQAANQVAQGWK